MRFLFGNLLNKLLKYGIILVLGLLSTRSFAEDTLLTVTRPRIGLGTGVMAYYGEIQSYQRRLLPTVNRFGGNLYVNAPITKFFNVELNATYAKIAANERSLTSNNNFESRIRMGTIYLYYNFYPLFTANRSRFHPFVGIGLSSFEFLSKTDLYQDKTGLYYYYWSDGSIRDRAEDDPTAANAKYLERDYSYETDLREQDLDGLGKYREQSFAFPMTAGFEWHLSPRWDFRVACAYHLTFTDLIDNVTHDAPEDSPRRGDKNNDRLVYTYVSLSYDLRFKKKGETEGEEEDEDIPLYADFDQVDWDKDGVIDAYDECPGTPVEALVDEKGCPLDEDKDGVPDFLDEEPGTPEGNWVDEYGVTLTEEQIQRHWELYNDSTGYLHDFAEMRTEINPLQDDKTKGELPRQVKDRSYVVIVGREHKDVTANDLHKYLGYKDFKTIERGDTVFYVIGEYDNIQDAVAAGKSLKENGVDVDVIAKNNYDSGNMTAVEDKVLEKVTNLNDKENVTIEEHSPSSGFFRVQLGAFSKKIDLNTSYRDLPDVNYAMGQDGLYHYYTGSFNTYEEAEAHRKDVAYKKGYKKAFVVAYKGESRVLLEDIVEDDKLPDNYDPNKELNTFVEEYKDPNADSKVDMAKVKYHVMLGYFPGKVPIETVDILYNIGGVQPVKGFDGSTTYYSTAFDTDAERDKALKEYQEMGLENIEKVVKYEGNYYTPKEWKKYLDSL